MRLRKVDAVASESKCRLDQPRPREPAVGRMQGAEPGREPGHAAGRDPDGVVHELGPERDLQLEQLDVASFAAEPRNSDEAVEVPRAPARRVEVDRVPAPE